VFSASAWSTSAEWPEMVNLILSELNAVPELPFEIADR
jgi:hypothetical protein